MQDVILDKPMLNHIVELANAKITKTREDSSCDTMAQLMDSFQLEPEINEARTLYFKTKIKLGDYEINDMAIAKKLLNLETM